MIFLIKIFLPAEADSRAKGLNTNSSMEISFFNSDEQRAEYMNGN